MWKNPENRAQFVECVEELLKDPDVRAMEEIRQHKEGISCLDHSIFVAYLSFLMCRRLGLDFVAAARGGLLHDLYLCKWEETEVGMWERLVVHPKMALKNASKFELSDLEKDIIVKHMWPVTLSLPRHRESVVVSLADKICTVAELCYIYRLTKVGEHLGSFLRKRVPNPGFAR